MAGNPVELSERKLSVIMFVMNDLLNDPRVQREARLAARSGLRVKVVCLQSERCRIEHETVDGYEIHRVHVKSPRFGVIRVFYQIYWYAGSYRWAISKVQLIIREAFNLAVGLPLGTEAPDRDPAPPSRLRRFKWALMRGLAIFLVPARILRPFLLKRRRSTGASMDSRQPSCSGPPAWLVKHIGDIGFWESTIWTILAMLKAVRHEPADVYHGNDLPTLPLTIWAAKRARGKAVYDSHEVWVGMNPETTPFFNRVSRWIEARYIRRMDAVVTVNELIAERLQREYVVPLPMVVMNCPEPCLPGRLDSHYSIRLKLGLSADTPLILYQGRYEPGRGLEQLIESGSYLSKGVIVLRGYGSNEPDLRAWIRNLGLSERVFMVEPVAMADLVNAAAEADIGVVPYTAYSPGYYFASPNKLFEYMMGGLAIAVSNLPFLEKIVLNHDLGVVFDPKDPRDIAEHLNSLVENRDRLRSCRENASRLARERYHWNHEGGKLVELYRALARSEA
jgi:glycosyltransferase involved in cell wall biosynthesis